LLVYLSVTESAKYCAFSHSLENFAGGSAASSRRKDRAESRVTIS
jgi:hypothetical protein